MLLKTYPQLLLILVLRHPERFNLVAELIEKQKLSYIRCCSAHVNPDLLTQVVLGDTSLLMLMYGISDIAFVGKLSQAWGAWSF